jgi:hypothetical protein
MKSTKANTIREKFVSTFEKTLKEKLVPKKEISNNVYEINSCKLFIYIAVISGAKTNSVSWRVAENTISKINPNYFIVFLEKSDTRGYIVAQNDVEYYLNNNIWVVTEKIKNKGTISVNKKRLSRNTFNETQKELFAKIISVFK